MKFKDYTRGIVRLAPTVGSLPAGTMFRWIGDSILLRVIGDEFNGAVSLGGGSGGDGGWPAGTPFSLKDFTQRRVTPVKLFSDIVVYDDGKLFKEGPPDALE